MKGNNHLFALTTSVDEITGEVKPLFGFPVSVCKAVESNGDVSFDNAAPSGSTYTTCYRDDATGEMFEYGDRIKGIRVGDDFKPIPVEQIEEIDEATKMKTMVALGRLPLAEAWEKYGDRIKGRFFLQSPPPAKGGSPNAYRLTYEALREVKKGKKVETPAQAIVTKRTATSRQQLAFIYADENLKCLVMVAVEFAAKLREPDAMVLAPTTAEVEQAQVDMARKVVAGLADGTQAMDAEVDEALTLREALIELAVEGEGFEAPAKAVAETVEGDNLKAALEASLAAG